MKAPAVASASISSGGFGSDFTPGDYDATQLSTSGSGTGAIINVTIDLFGNVTAINSITNGGSGYVVNDSIALDNMGGGTYIESLNPVLDVSSIT